MITKLNDKHADNMLQFAKLQFAKTYKICVLSESGTDKDLFAPMVCEHIEMLKEYDALNIKSSHLRTALMKGLSDSEQRLLDLERSLQDRNLV